MIIPLLDLFMEPWQILATIGVLLCAIEALIPGFVFLPIGLGFLMTALFAPFLEGWDIRLMVLTINCLLVFFGFKWWVAPRFTKDEQQTGVGGMIGKVATVTEDIEPGGENGYVKLYGDRWQALSKNNVPIAKGAKVTILEMDGNKVIVEALEAKTVAQDTVVDAE